MSNQNESKTQLLTAEVMSVGDEMTTGQRLDTNAQWISQALGEIGIQVRFHTTVGDDLNDHINVLKIAMARVDLIIMTGGLGPTADDLTRTAIAQAAGVELEFHPSVLEHIRNMYHSRGREMPASNRAQAYFPSGSKIINNPEGTAPGIDLTTIRDNQTCRTFAVPGVPVEMKQMWAETVQPELQLMISDASTFHHHTLHCFGLGESSIEQMLPDLIERGRDPQVGITASSATISLRVSTRGPNKAVCLTTMEPTLETIREKLGDLVYGENGQTLLDVVQQQLQSSDSVLTIIDQAFDGEFGREFIETSSMSTESSHRVLPNQELAAIESADDSLLELATKAFSNGQTNFVLAIGEFELDESKIAAGKSFFEVILLGDGLKKIESISLGGHSGWRFERAKKQVLNFLRLELNRINSTT